MCSQKHVIGLVNLVCFLFFSIWCCLFAMCLLLHCVLLLSFFLCSEPYVFQCRIHVSCFLVLELFCHCACIFPPLALWCAFMSCVLTMFCFMFLHIVCICILSTGTAVVQCTLCYRDLFLYQASKACHVLFVQLMYIPLAYESKLFEIIVAPILFCLNYNALGWSSP